MISYIWYIYRIPHICLENLRFSRHEHMVDKFLLKFLFTAIFCIFFCKFWQILADLNWPLVGSTRNNCILFLKSALHLNNIHKMIWYLVLYDLSLDIWERTLEMIFWHFDGLLRQITKELIKKDLCLHKKISGSSAWWRWLMLDKMMMKIGWKGGWWESLCEEKWKPAAGAELLIVWAANKKLMKCFSPGIMVVMRVKQPWWQYIHWCLDWGLTSRFRTQFLGSGPDF